MKNYLITIIWVSIIVAIIEILAPSLESIKKHLKLIGSLCVVCAVVAPLLTVNSSSNKIFNDLKENITGDIEKAELQEQYQDKLTEYLYSYSETKFKDEIYEHLNQKFDIPKENAEIKLKVNRENEKVSVEQMQIILSGNSIFKNPYNIEDYFQKLINCKCEVLIK